MGRLGMGEILVLLVVVLVLFGGARLPQLGSSLGQAIRNFKRGFAGEDDAEPGETSAKAPGALAGGSSTQAERDRAPASKVGG